MVALYAHGLNVEANDPVVVDPAPEADTLQQPMRVMFATAELAPLAKVGGLGDAASGLVKALGKMGVDVDVVLPDYWDGPHRSGEVVPLAVPGWAGRAEAHVASVAGPARVHLLSTPSLPRPDPYNDSDGRGWPDNDLRFFSFSAAVAAFATMTGPDVLHLNDWHTGAVLGFLENPPPSVFTMHNPAYQGVTSETWLGLLHRPDAYRWYGSANPLAGALNLADMVTTVSPGFARELKTEETSFGLSELLEARAGSFLGILNGIDTDTWDPETDVHLPVNYGIATVTRKRRVGDRLREEVGLVEDGGPLVGMVSRLTDQKGVDLALHAIAAIPDDDVAFVLLGSGDRELASSARQLAERDGSRFVFVESFNEGLAHRIFAASDLVIVPSRFEPCGLTQMQAMRYGAMPVVTAVGGLGDTVVDADGAAGGTGFVAAEVSAEAVHDALVRAIAAWRSTRRRGAIRERGMLRDWSWRKPAVEYAAIYEKVSGSR